ncbi:MAG: hypothetical protein Q8R57_06795, partial [Bacteroidota bacterium]|nr:hypothetical protein [Bacteroidota bacterium]
KLIYLFLTLILYLPQNKPSGKLLESRIKIIEKKYASQLKRIYFYKGENCTNSNHLSTINSCGINIKDIKSIVSYRHLKKEYNYIPITIELWEFESNQKAILFNREIEIKSPLIQCALLKISSTSFVKDNIVVSITGNPKQQLLLDKIYSELKRE